MRKKTLGRTGNVKLDKLLIEDEMGKWIRLAMTLKRIGRMIRPIAKMRRLISCLDSFWMNQRKNRSRNPPVIVKYKATTELDSGITPLRWRIANRKLVE